MINVAKNEPQQVAAAATDAEAIRAEERQRITAILAIAQGGNEKVQARAQEAITKGEPLAPVVVEITALKEQAAMAASAPAAAGAPAVVATGTGTDAADDAYWAKVKGAMAGVQPQKAAAGNTAIAGGAQ